MSLYYVTVDRPYIITSFTFKPGHLDIFSIPETCQNPGSQRVGLKLDSRDHHPILLPPALLWDPNSRQGRVWRASQGKNIQSVLIPASKKLIGTLYKLWVPGPLPEPERVGLPPGTQMGSLQDPCNQGGNLEKLLKRASELWGWEVVQGFHAYGRQKYQIRSVGSTGKYLEIKRSEDLN